MAPGAVVLAMRHGETASNRARRYAGGGDESLTPRGVRQVEVAAASLIGAGIGEIRSSTIRRARESADIVSRVLGAPVREEPRLNELQMGPWEGLTETEVQAAFPAEYHLWETRPSLVRQPGRETLGALARRVAAVADEVRQADRPVLLVSHVAPIRVLRLLASGASLDEYRLLDVPNAALVPLVWHADVPRPEAAA